MTEEKEIYKVMLCQGIHVGTVHTEEEAWDLVGQSWAAYTVYDGDGKIREEFVPF